MKRSSALSVAVLCLSAAAISRADIVVNTGGSVTCVTKGGESGFQAYSFSIGGMDTGTTIPGKGAPGKPQFSVLNITKNLDNCSAQLVNAFLESQSLPTVKLLQFKTSSDGNAVPFLVIQLTNVVVSNYQMNSGGQSVPSETISFSYQAICIGSRPEAQGINACYDASKNVVLKQRPRP